MPKYMEPFRRNMGQINPKNEWPKAKIKHVKKGFLAVYLDTAVKLFAVLVLSPI